MTRGLDRETVVQTALDLLDEVGAEAFSMRAVSRRLGVFDNAVHHHVRTRDELLVAVADRLISQVELPELAELNWRDWLALVASSYRSVAARHSGAAPVLSDALPFAASSQRLSAAVVSCLLDAGATPEQALHGHNAYVGFLTGFQHVEASRARRLRLPDLPAPNLLAYVDAAHRKPLQAALERLAVSASQMPPGVTVHDATFTGALDVVLDGLADLLRQPARTLTRNR